MGAEPSPIGDNISVGGANGHHGNTRGRSQALSVTVALGAGLMVTMATLRWAEPTPMETLSLWVGLKVTMATLRWAEPILWQQHPCGWG